VKFIKKILCWLGHHSICNRDIKKNDPLGFLMFAECRWCGYKGQIDSQGNLF
jgi:hypothetical protein